MPYTAQARSKGLDYERLFTQKMYQLLVEDIRYKK